MRLLMNDLKLNQDRGTLKRILENAVPQTLQDVVIVYAAVTGTQDGELREENYVNKIYPQMIAGRLWSAIQVTTAAGHLRGRRPGAGASGQVHGLRRRRSSSACPRSSPTASAATTPQGGTKDVSGDVVVTGKAGRQRRSTRGEPTR